MSILDRRSEDFQNTRYANLVVRFSQAWNPISQSISCSFLHMLLNLLNAYMRRVRDMQTLLFVSFVYTYRCLFVSVFHHCGGHLRKDNFE